MPSVPQSGIVPPLVTPLTGRDDLDVAGLDRLVERVLAGGVAGLFVLGTTGEGPALSHRLQREVVRRVCRQVNGRVPVLVGATDPAAAETVALAAVAADEGAAAAVVAPPYYFPPSQSELADYFDALAADIPLPLVAYNIPGLVRVPIEPETVAHLRDNPRVVAFKDSSGDLDYFTRVVEVAKGRPGWPVFVGPEHLLADATALGGSGGVSGGANIDPKLFVDWFNAARAGDAAAEVLLQARAARLGRLYETGYGSMGVVKALKCALAELGVCDDRPADPFRRLDAAARSRVRGIVRELFGGESGPLAPRAGMPLAERADHSSRPDGTAAYPGTGNTPG
jgi:dihydrodipicolinate synthase/N-acetylneuraminate lyase